MKPRAKAPWLRRCYIYTVTSACALFVMANSVQSAAQTVGLSPGDNIQLAVNANPAGTTFTLQTGVYRMQAVVPKNGDIFTGQSGADLNGSQVLSNWVQNGSYWTYTGAPAQSTPLGPATRYCNDPSTGCAYPQDLYLNNVPLVHKLALPVSSGQWYFDYTNDVIYMADNPNGQIVELSVTARAFGGSASNVTVQKLIVEKYATPLGNPGTIGPVGPSWTIQSNEARLNHGAGIKSGTSGGNYEQILSNYAHDNGQEGISVSGGTGSLVEYNTSSNNNYANILDGYEEGGGKIAANGTQVLNNTYTNNNGMGLWADSGSSGLTFSGNTLSGNRRDGIRAEISHYITISNNTLSYNAQYKGTGPCTPGGANEISLAQSDNTNVSNNTITSNCAGIRMSAGSRNNVVNDVVVNNTTSYPGTAQLKNLIGGVDSSNPPTLYNPANGSYFDYNTYHFGAPVTVKNWTWDGTPMNPLDWGHWQAAGEDIHGTAD